MGKRVDVKTGFLCNNNCLFCVQADNKLRGNRSFEEIKKDLEDSKKRCDSIVLTGGEVTIREDFLDIVRLAKKLGYKNIQIQSNGRMFSNLDFCKKAIEAGATEFSPALHGYCAEQHDYLTQSPGSFAQTVKGIRNLKNLGAYVLTNTVIVKPNYRNAEQIAKLLVKLGVDQYQLAFVHPMGNAYKNFDSMVPVISLAAPFIHNGLDVGIKAGRGVMAEAMPYCHMKGYELFVSENYIPNTEIRGKKHQNIDDYKMQRIVDGKSKFKKCVECLHESICEGSWKEYPKKYGGKEFVPIILSKENILEEIKKIDEKDLFFLEKLYFLLGLKSVMRINKEVYNTKKAAFKGIEKYDYVEDDDYFFVSRNKKNAFLAKIFTDKNKKNKNKYHRRILGLLYGYPFCCSENYSESFNNIKNSKNPIGGVKKLKNFSYNNKNLSTIHLPCSNECVETKRLKEKIMKKISDYNLEKMITKDYVSYLD